MDVKGGSKPASARHGAVLTENACNWMDPSQWWIATILEPVYYEREVT